MNSHKIHPCVRIQHGLCYFRTQGTGIRVRSKRNGGCAIFARTQGVSKAKPLLDSVLALHARVAKHVLGANSGRGCKARIACLLRTKHRFLGTQARAGVRKKCKKCFGANSARVVLGAWCKAIPNSQGRNFCLCEFCVKK